MAARRRCFWLRRLIGAWSCAAGVSLGEAPLQASDHADPIMLQSLEAGITDLFAFPQGDQLVLILCVRRALTSPPPLPLDSYTYKICIDTHSELNIDDADSRARYGAEVVSPSGIAPDVTIELQLNNDATLKTRRISGLSPDAVRVWTGLRDDPFIFHRFLTTNVVAMVLEVPFAEFPPDQLDWLVWGASSRFGQQIDHVGRSLRTMNPRLDFLNTLPPAEHLGAIQRQHTDPGLLQDFSSWLIPTLFGIRHYDFEPDVLVYTKRYEVGFPNGRRLTDDVADLACRFGDCLLYEVSLADAHADGKTRPTANNKPFLDQFPYLAEPNPERKPGPRPALKTRTMVILGLAGAALAAFIALPWVLFWKSSRQARRLRKALTLSAPMGGSR